MNASRVAKIHRQLAQLHAELADEMDRGSAPMNDTAPPKKPRRKPIRKPYVPQRQFSEFEKARARQRARKLGIPTA